MIRQMLAEGRALHFEYYDVYPSEGTSMRDVARAEFVFLLMHTGKLLPGNLKADGLSLFPDKENQRPGDALPPDGAGSEASSERNSSQVGVRSVLPRTTRERVDAATSPQKKRGSNA
jgi:hypothetical protein